MRSFFGAILLMIGLCLSAQPSGYNPVADMAAFSTQFTAASQKTQSLTTDFVQEKNTAMLAAKNVSSGKFWFKKQNLLRMEFLKPTSYLLVMNHQKIYIKDGQKVSKVGGRSSKMFQQINRIILDCMQGTVLANPDFSTTVFENSAGYLLEMRPKQKAMKSVFEVIQLTVARNNFMVNKMNMKEPGGDNTLLIFSNTIINSNIADATFAIP